MNWFDALFLSKPQSQPSSPSTRPKEKRLLELPKQSSSVAPSEVSENATQTPETHLQPRQNRNAVIFGAGCAFFAFSLLTTRRSLTRKRLASNPAFYTNAPGHQQHQAQIVSGPVEALEALSIATINVLSLAMLGTGGALWYFDINSMADAKRKFRGGLGVDGSGKSEGEAEEEFEEWLASTLSEKEAKEKRKVEQKRFNERGNER